MRTSSIAGLLLAALLAAGAPVLAQDRDQMFVTGALSGVLGPDMASPKAVRKTQHALAAAVTAYAEVQLGRPLTNTDRERHDEAAITALWLTPGPSPVGWRNFRTRLHGEITPGVGIFGIGQGVCRNYDEYIFVSPQSSVQFKAVACYDRATQAWTVWPRTPDNPAG